MAKVKSHMFIYICIYRADFQDYNRRIATASRLSVNRSRHRSNEQDTKTPDLAACLVNKMQRYEGHLAETKCHQFSLPI